MRLIKALTASLAVIVSWTAMRADAPVQANSVPPRIVKQDPPVYPKELAASGIKGEVMVGFIVDTEGKVWDPFVIASSNAAFERPAVEAVRLWKFDPARVNGRAVNVRMKVPVIFDIEGGGGRDAFRTTPPGRADQKQLPESLRYGRRPTHVPASLRSSRTACCARAGRVRPL